MDHLDHLDHRILSALRVYGCDPRVAGAARALSWAGEHGALWLAAGLAGAAVDGARRGAWLRGTALTAGAHLVSMGVKRVVRRPRPAHITPLVRTAGRHSFPSSHAASATAAAVAFGLLGARGSLGAAGMSSTREAYGSGEAHRRGEAHDVHSAPPAPRPRGARTALTATCAVLPPLAAAMCLSRLIVGVHYPSDVAAGAALGALTVCAGARWMRGGAHG